MTILSNKLKIAVFGGILIKIATALSGLLVGALISRLYTVEEVGVYFLVISLARFVSLTLKFGADRSLQKFGGIAFADNDTEAIRKIVSFFMLLLLVLSTIYVTTGSLYWTDVAIKLNLPLEYVYLLLLLGLAPIRALEAMLSGLLRAVGKLKLGVFMLDTPRAMLMLISLAAINIFEIRINVTSVLVLYLFFSMAPVFYSLYYLRKYIRYTDLSIRSDNSEQFSVKEITRVSGPLMMLDLAGFGIKLSSLFVVSTTLGQHMTGIYAAVIQLALPVSMVLTIVNQVTPASIAVLFRDGKLKDLEILMRKTAGWASTICIPIVLVLGIYGEDVLNFIYGREYREGHLALTMLALAQLVNVVVGSPGRLMEMAGKQRPLLLFSLFWALVGVASSYTLAHFFGLNGAALGAATGIVGHNITMAIYVRFAMGIVSWPKLFQGD